jgi:hypothetical protein
MHLKTETTARRRPGILTQMPAWIRRRQRELSDRVHAARDERARQHGWEVTKSTGRFGLGTRSYRDPRFSDRRWLLGRRPTEGPIIGCPNTDDWWSEASDREASREPGE